MTGRARDIGRPSARGGLRVAAVAGGVATLIAVGVHAVQAREAARGAARVVVDRYPDGHVMRRAEYRGAKLDGVARGWYDDGAAEYVRGYRDGLEDGVHRGWYDNGTLKFEYHYRNGLSEGAERQWYPDGAPFTLLHDHLGHEAGQQQMWNADGSIRSNYVIKDGRRYGLLGAEGCSAAEPEHRARRQAGATQ